MEKLVLKLEPRTVVGKKVKNLRKEGLVPAAICGKGVTAENFVADARIFGRVYQRAGRNALVELQMPGGTSQAFIRQVQKHPISGVWLHVDFHIVDMRTEMTTAVPVVAVGESPLMKEGAMVALVHQTLQVRALPADLPQALEVDISGIEDYTTTLHVSDLKVGPGVTIMVPAEEPLLTINPSTTALEEAAITEQEQLGEPELMSEGVGPKDLNNPEPVVDSASETPTLQ